MNACPQNCCLTGVDDKYSTTLTLSDSQADLRYDSVIFRNQSLTVYEMCHAYGLLPASFLPLLYAHLIFNGVVGMSNYFFTFIETL